MALIDQKLEAWKNKLLDLGKRNRLLNYRDTKRSNLRINKPEIFELWDSFVENEISLEFPYYDDDQLSSLENDNSEIAEAAIITNQSIKERQKTLRSLREKAKTAMEEQGVNILYLSFGFLCWREDDNSEQYLLSPIVLVPVTLTLESITSPFILRLHEDEITLNPTLIYKLSNDFGIHLPEFDSYNGIKIYLHEIEDLIKNNKWEVMYDTGLSLLSFLKINMYHDLEVHKDTIKNNPIVRALSGDVAAINNTDEDINNFDHDSKTTPVELFQVVDADSSQQDAVLMAKKGISFVLQGPPGTGKSQTITNIIAERLAFGKKVLFVSEKMAALEVVRKRLTAAGLADFCLTLHSYKANKKEVLEQLSVTLNLSKRQAKLSDEAFQKLELLQDTKGKLNEYARQIFEVVEPLGEKIYNVHGYLANLESYDNIVFNLTDVVQTTPQKYNRYIHLLREFSSTIGKQSGDYKDNPWYGAHIPALTYELRHNIEDYLTRLLEKIKRASDICDKISIELCLDSFSSYAGMESLMKILILGAQSPKAPIDWVVKDDVTHLQDDIRKYDKLKHSYQELQHELVRIIAELSANDSDALFSDPLQLITTLQIKAEEEKASQLISDNYCYLTWENGHYIKAQSLYEEARQKVQVILGLRESIATIFEREIFDIDYKSILNRFKTEYTSFLKIFKGQYKADKKVILGSYKQIAKKVSDAEVISILTSLKQIDEASHALQGQQQSFEKYFGDRYVSEKTDFDAFSRSLKAFNCIQQFREKIVLLHDIAKTIENQDNEMRRQFTFLYNGVLTDWQSVLQSLTWASNLKKLYIQCDISKNFVEFVCSNDEQKSRCSEYYSILSECVKGFDVEFSWYLSLFETANEIKSIPMPALYDRIQLCKNLALLEEWIDFQNARTNCQKEGLTDYIDKIGQLNIKAEYIIPMFRKRFYRLWLDAVLPNYPAVLNFRRRTQRQTIDEFVYLDKLQFDIAKARIKKTLVDELPSFDRVTSSVDELNTLKRELGKQRRIMPIRKLFRSIPNLLLTLKPCLMMSPLSVSLFLEAESYDFDTVIFDEASQVCTENAIGAISRGKQVIIAGDSKQLPPTNFFSASISDADFDNENEEDEFDDPNAYESILDEAALLPERTLLWHYRSKHEHLIAFSNAKIYRNNLITFPANVDKAPDNGVQYIYVPDGFYDRGGKKGNVIEAKRVALLIFAHIKKSPNRSLGVIAFGEVQQQAIDTVLRQMRKDDQRYESFFDENNDEAFFVKNLENVQGDERDTIIFSIGYAKDAAGKFTMNFGPLSKGGGERRLNVAITRAKYNIKLVGSISPTDIDADRVSAEGPKLLRSYIDFAINGPSVILRETTESDIVEHDSPFEAAVYNFLDRKGYRLGTQVGCSGYRIDMAVKHPSISGCYVLGIECDGAAYHSARTARERDRLRQAVLEDMGWTIYRIWSTDWIKDPIAEGQKLIEAVDRAISEYSDNRDNNGNDNLPIASFEEDSFLRMDEKEENLDDAVNPYNFEKQKQTNFSDLPRNATGDLDIADRIKAVIENEYPIHYELLCKRMAPLYGKERATPTIQGKVLHCAGTRVQGIIRKGVFFYPADYTTIVPKAAGNTRSIDHISPDELAEAMFIIVSNSYGIMREDLFRATAREYGFTRLGIRIWATMKLAYDLLLKSKRVKETDEKVIKC